ncbi:MAG TPA: GxxExxY protein [Symbiobacteriaceae bacterium]|nr:GxxExxY protein [Symbiobacteriaceae bacterium]
MKELLHEEITSQVIGAAIDVHKALGPGFLESVYEGALVHELALRGLSFERQVRVPIFYKNVQVCTHILDLVIENKIIVELKSIHTFAEVHQAIVLSYLSATQLPVALMINFGQPKLDMKRLVGRKHSA